jgi:hypothetical protein
LEPDGTVAVFLRAGDWKPKEPKYRLKAVKDVGQAKQGWRMFSVSEAESVQKHHPLTARVAKLEEQVQTLTESLQREQERNSELLARLAVLEQEPPLKRLHGASDVGVGAVVDVIRELIHLYDEQNKNKI